MSQKKPTAAELEQIVERVTDKVADEIMKGSRWRHPHINASIVNERDPERPTMRVIEKDRMGKPRTWVYGPYMIGKSSYSDSYFGSLLIGTKLWGEEVLDELPGEFDAMPLGLLQQNILASMWAMKKRISRIAKARKQGGCK